MSLRKHIAILLSFFLFVSNLGLAFNVHYCGDEIESVTLAHAKCATEAEIDCCGIVEKDSKCCNDKIIKSEVKSDLIIVKSLSFETYLVLSTFDRNPLVGTYNLKFKRDIISYCFNTNAPPLYLMYSQYIFYA